MAVPKRVAERITAGIKAYHSILVQQRDRDVSEADTVTVVKDLLCDVFGYDKYAELTSEHSIRGTYCDLAVKINGKLVYLIEVKAVGTDLKDSHVKQAIDYAANQGCEWVILTNGIEWRLYHVLFKKPIDKQELVRIDMLKVSPKSESDMDKLFLIAREGFGKDVLATFRDRKDATSRFMLAAIVLCSESVQTAIRREIRRVSEISVEPEVIDRILREEVIKRETIEGEHADAACRRVNRSAKREAAAPKPATTTTIAPATAAQAATA